jgi:acyl-CoA synthetase (AMP-forming)/AMP-acid ligase II
LTHDDVLLCVLPFSFDVGLNQLLSAMVAGCAILLSESWLPADIVRLVAQFNMTGISGVPAIWNDLLNTGMRFDTSAEHRSLRYVTVSGGDLPPARLEALRVAVGSAGIIKTYGQSETFRSAALLPEEFSAKPRSVGKPFAGARVYIVRANGTLAAPNEPGEIVHTGLGTMLGYLDADRENVNPDSNPRPNPFFSEIDRSRVAIFTGDTGWLDEEGFLYVQGREDAMLKVAGNRVYPKEIADQFAAFDDIAEVEVIGRKDTLGETRIYAFVVPRNESSLDPADLRRRLIQRLPSYMVPQEIRIVPALPRTASGKPDRPALMAQL